MGDNVNIIVPKYYYWEGQSPTIPDTDTKVEYKLVGPDSTTIQLTTGFTIENSGSNYSIKANNSRKIIITFSSGVAYSNQDKKVVAKTTNGTIYTFTGSATGKSNQYDVNNGNIKITESSMQIAQNNLKSGVKLTADAGNKYVQNTASQAEFLNTTTIFSSSKTMDNLSKLFYFFFKDFFTLVVLAFFVITLIIILRVDAAFLYPFDTDKYPYVTPSLKRKVSEITSGDSFCTDDVVGDVSVPEKPKDPNIIQVVNIFNETMAEPSQNRINWYSESFQNTCKHTTNTTSGAFTILKYWMLYLVLKTYVNTQATLNTLHRSLSIIANESFMIIVFTILLFALFYFIPNINIGVIQPYFHYDGGQEVRLNEGTFDDYTGERGFTNLLAMIVFNILALMFVVFVPLYIILSASGLIANISSLISILLNTASVECMFLSFFSLISSINYILKLLPEDLDITKIVIEKNIINIGKQIIDFILNMFKLVKMPELSVNNIFFFFINILTFLGSIFGIFLPCFMALYFSLVTTYNITKAMIFLPIKNIKIIKTLAPVLVLLLLILLLKNVSHILGTYLMVITIFIILITGYIMLTK